MATSKALQEAPKEYHKNPRKITQKQFDLLELTLKELGDLSGVVHDLNSNEIIGGNQRSKVFGFTTDNVVLEHTYKKPTETGTVATGYIEFNGEHYAYRQVKWTPKQCERANIIANKGGGTWDWDILANQFEMSELNEWGFEPYEFGFSGDKLGLEGEHTDTEKKTAVPGGSSGEDSVMFQMMVSNGNRDMIYETLERVKNDKLLKTNEEALISIFETFNQ